MASLYPTVTDAEFSKLSARLQQAILQRPANEIISPLTMPSRLKKLPLRLPSTTTFLQRHAFGSEREFDTLRTACHTQRVVHISQIRGDQIVVTFYPVEQNAPWASVLAPIVVPSQ